MQTDDLLPKANCNVDYTQLRDLLAAKRWKEADYETYLVINEIYLVIIKVDSKEDEDDWIREEELLNFLYTDLRTIDQLWVNFSNGRFGFSVQKKIYLEVGGKPDGKFNRYEEAWEKFCDRVGWRVKEEWIEVPDGVTYDTLAPVGHLPSMGFWEWGIREIDSEKMKDL